MAAQSSGECPGASTTLREGFGGGGISDEGAMDEFDRTFVGGTRSMEAAEGGGLRAVPFVGRGGGGVGLNVGGFSRGGSSEGMVVGGGFGGAMGLPFSFGEFWNLSFGCAPDDSAGDVRESEGVEVGLREVVSSVAAPWKAEL